MCVCVGVYAQECRCLQIPEEGTGGPEATFTSSWELPDESAGNQTPVLHKSSVLSLLLSNLSRL